MVEDTVADGLAATPPLLMATTSLQPQTDPPELGTLYFTLSCVLLHIQSYYNYCEHFQGDTELEGDGSGESTGGRYKRP